jgi:hypothetical protein
MGRWGILCIVVLALAAIAPATADVENGSWLPHPTDATWTYEWSDSVYNTTLTDEKVTVKDVKGASFVLAWTTKDQGNAQDALSSEGVMAFQETSSGLVNTDWQSTPPPSTFPILCSSASQCGNSVASVLYQLIWGSRSPVLAEPLITGATWASTGGANSDVTSVSTYLGQEKVTVPAFTDPVTAAKVRSDITQAGAIGDPYGSGVRTVWWVYGVGPVKIVFEHAGGTDAAISTAVLKATSLTPPATPPVDSNYFPLKQGKKSKYSWSNTKWMKKPSIQQFTVSQTANQSARVDVKHISGPIRVAGSYGFALRTDGLTNIWGATKAATIAKFPKLGPQAPSLLHRLRPDDLRDEPDPRGQPGARPDLGRAEPEPRLLRLRRHRVDDGARFAQGDGSGRHLYGACHSEHAEPGRLPVRLGHAHLVLRAGQGARQAGLPPR